MKQIMSCFGLLFSLLFTLLSPNLAFCQPEIPQKKIQQRNYDPVTILDTLIDEIKKQLDQTYGILSGVSVMIGNGQIPSIKNKKESLTNIKAINQLIQNILREKFLHSDINTVYFLVELNRSVMLHMLRALKKGFKVLPAYDPTSLINRTLKQEPDFNHLQKRILQNKKLLKKLEFQADRAGLNWLNLAYRKIDNAIVRPCYKHQIPYRALLAAGTISAGLLVWWKLAAPHHTFDYLNNPPVINDESALQNEKEDQRVTRLLNNAQIETNVTTEKNSRWYRWVPEPVQRFFGPRIQQDGFLGAVSNANELGTVGKLEHNTMLILKGYLPITSAILGFSATGLFTQWKDSFKPWLTKKISVIVNKLRGGAYLKEAQKAANEIDDVSFDDLVGLDHVKDSFKLLVNYLENPEPYDRLGLTPPKGVLLIGETRTGKSYSVKALMGEINAMQDRINRHNEFAFFELNASDIDQHGIGYLLNLIKHAAPCVVFIDEIDLLNLQRKGKNKTLSEFLTCMSGTMDSKDPKNQVIIIAATNRPENLDEALRQPGRFGKELRFEYPSWQDRHAYISRKLDKLSLSEDAFDIDKLARETNTKSFEALNILINNAVLKARIRGQVVTQEHIEETLDEELRHVVNIQNKEVPENEKLLLASHFAGHALVLSLLDIETKLAKVTIKQVMTDIHEVAMETRLYYPNNKDANQDRFEYGKVFTCHNGDTINMNTLEEKRALIQFHLAGIVAEELLLGSCGYSCHPKDMEHALALAQSIAFEGLDSKQLPKHMQKKRFDMAFNIIAECKQLTRTLLENNKHVLEKISLTLREQETLTATDIASIINPPAIEKLN